VKNGINWKRFHRRSIMIRKLHAAASYEKNAMTKKIGISHWAC
jgi:hypothetical protein